MRQGMFHGHTLPQLRPSLRRLLAFPQLLQQGFIRMNRVLALHEEMYGCLLPSCF
jgi:hypothetical protein